MARKEKATKQETDDRQSAPIASPAAPGEDTNGEIVSANLRALQPVYFAAMLEEARLFDVVDCLVTMFSQGTLSIGPGRAGAVLYRHWKSQHTRFTTEQRRNVYARAFGLPGGDPSVLPNRDFNDLWVRFVSIVGMYSAELQSLPPGQRSVGTEEVLVSGRALASNLSSRGHGLAWFAASDFKVEMQQVIELLSDVELQNEFGAKTPWQLLQTVAAVELGARPNVPRGHTRAENGAIIIRWLANRRARLLRPRTVNILKHEDICEGRTAVSQNKNPAVYPTDSDLVTACEHWLGVTGTQEVEWIETSPVDVPA
jgi:hypothetical protein